MHLSSEAYDVFEQVFQGKDNAKKVMRALEKAIVTTVHDSWYRTKKELKVEVFSHFATKDDLELLRIELLGKTDKDKAELSGRIDALYQKTEKDKADMLLRLEKIDKKFSLYFALLLFAIIFLNQNALEFIAKFIGIVRWPQAGFLKFKN